MKKIIILLNFLIITQLTFADDIFLISTQNQCALIPNNIKPEDYFSKVSQNKKWLAVKNQQSKSIKLNDFQYNQEPCNDTIFTNNKDKNINKYDFITNQGHNLYPVETKKITDKNEINILNEKVNKYIKDKYNVTPKKAKKINAISGLKFNNNQYSIIHISTYKDLMENTKKGDYSGVFLVNINNEEIIEVMALVANKTNKNELIQSPPYNIEIESILDIDNDGEYEILVKGTYYEGSDSSLYKIVNNKAIQKRACGCGL